MKKLTRGILTGLCAVIGVSAGAAICTFHTQDEVETAYAASTYATKDIAMMGRIAGWHGNGNFEVRLTLGECDWTAEAQKSYVGENDLAWLLKQMDFFNHIAVGGKTLAEWGCTACYDNIYWLNQSEPDHTITIPLSMGKENMTAATAAGVGGGSLITILEGALIPSDAYLQGDTTATVYRAGCEFETISAGVDYGIAAIAKTEVESLQYTTGWDATYNNAYLGVSLKGDDYAGNGTQTERAADYGSDIYMTNKYTSTLKVNGEIKAEDYGLFNLGSKGAGYYSFVWRAQESELESITIPAGTMFPSQAMKTLKDANGHFVYIMYQTQTDVTFYKQADGTWKTPYTDKETSVVSAKVSGSDGDNFTILSLSEHDYATELDNYGGAAVSTKDILANGNFYTHVLINGTPLGSTNEAYVNVWGNKGAFAFRTSVGLATTEITILAGCQIPSYAELLTGARVRYVTAEDITFVKNAEGEWVEKAQLGDYLEAAKVELNSYKAGLFREAEEEQRIQIVENAKAQMNEALTEEAIVAIVEEAKAAIDALKTAAQYADEELAAVKAAAIEEVTAYRADEEYFEEEIAARNAIIETAKAEVAADTSEDEIAATIAQMKSNLDKVLNKAQVIEQAKAELNAYKAEDGYFKEEEAAKRVSIVEEAIAAIEVAASSSAISQKVAAAKSAIDELFTATEVYTAQDVAMLARIGGWYGNGNFTLKITLGLADWTNADEGTKNYDGDLAKLLNKIGLFDHIKLGDKTLAEWGCTACYDNGYELNVGEPDNILMLHLAMGKPNMDAATAAGIGADMPVTILEGAIVPSYGYLSKLSDVVYCAGSDYVSTNSTKPYGIESLAKVEVEDLKYVQGHDGVCGYFGISFVGDDYLGDGTQLEINTNHSFDNTFQNMVLVNGEAGKVGYYGLFNLGEKGKGYYAFKIDVPEEEIVYITIPAGTRFPTRAMTTLPTVNNNNGVYIMYEVEETLVLYKTENGYVSYVDAALNEVENYKVGMFREAEEAQRSEIVANAVATIKEALDNETIDTAVAEAKAAIDALKTAGQYADEENAALVEAKNQAIAELEAYKADGDYFEEQIAERAAIAAEAAEAIKALASEADIAAIVDSAKAAIDELMVKTGIVADAKAELDAYKAESGLFRPAQATERASIIANAKADIDAATTQAAVSQAVAGAKKAIDLLLTADEYYETEDVAMLARVGGWYGNGNFTMKITLGKADWTNADAGEKEYAGELAQLFEKLGVFDHIVLGGKTLAEWGCVACYDNKYELNTGEPDNILMLHLAMGEANMQAATAAGIGSDTPATILAGALIPSYGYLNKSGIVVYKAGCDYVTSSSTKAYGVESTAKVEIEDVKYVQGHDGVCGYLGISFVGDDFLGDGTQLDVNQNYYFDNKFSDLMLVNGETGKIGYYGLFNLGENGLGYYSFQIFATEEELVSITIPAGTRFPTRAMTDLYVVNANPVYIMYEIAEEITLYKTANGFSTYAEYAAEELETYKAGLFREAEETQRFAIISRAKVNMQGLDKAGVDAIVAQAKADIDALKTAAQYADEELAGDKQAAIDAMTGYKADVVYLDEQAQARADIINTGKAKVAAAVSVEELLAIVEEAQAAIDELVIKETIVTAAKAEVEGYKADLVYYDEQAATKATVVAEALAAIDSATSQAAIEEIVANAKAAIDTIKTKAEVEADALAAKKEEANATVDALKRAVDFDLYEEDAIMTINSLYATVKAAIESAETQDAVDAAVAEFETALAEVPQKDNGGDTSSDTSSDTSTDTSVDTSVDNSSNAGSNTSSEEEKPGKSGCSSVAGGLVTAMTALVAAVAVLLKKKEN